MTVVVALLWGVRSIRLCRAMKPLLWPLLVLRYRSLGLCSNEQRQKLTRKGKAQQMQKQKQMQVAELHATHMQNAENFPAAC
jgi:hypothetical protein